MRKLIVICLVPLLFCCLSKKHVKPQSLVVYADFAVENNRNSKEAKLFSDVLRRCEEVLSEKLGKEPDEIYIANKGKTIFITEYMSSEQATPPRDMDVSKLPEIIEPFGFYEVYYFLRNGDFIAVIIHCRGKECETFELN